MDEVMTIVVISIIVIGSSYWVAEWKMCYDKRFVGVTGIKLSINSDGLLVIQPLEWWRGGWKIYQDPYVDNGKENSHLIGTKFHLMYVLPDHKEEVNTKFVE